MSDNRSFFVLGTDTDVGKTYVSAALMSGLLGLKKDYAYFKPVQTGGIDIDKAAVEKLLGRAMPSFASSYSYPHPLSPDQAAQLSEMEPVDLRQLVEDTSRHSQNKNLVIEGAGGLWVPLNPAAQTWVDFLQAPAVNCDVVVVARPSLGTLNHTISALHSLSCQGVRVKAVVLSGEQNQLNEDSLKRLMHRLRLAAPVFSLPEITSKEQLIVRSRALVESLLTASESDDAYSESNLKALDSKYCWHPYTQHQVELDPIFIDRAKEEFVYTKSGQKLFDATGSWWVNTIGHCHPRINSAIQRQQATLDHVLFANASHQPAIVLAEKINQFVDNGAWKVFFSDNGSTALEVALKMCYQSWQMRDEPNKKTFVALKGSYHGDTLGSMSVGGATEFHRMFAGLLFKAHFIEPCLSHRSAGYAHQDIDKNLRSLEQYFDENQQQICAFVVEPMIQGAGGMLMHDKRWLLGACHLARRFGIPVIFDEVFTGMGRTGEPVAANRLGFRPDVLCLAKGLTGGNLPLALTLATPEIFDGFLSDDKRRAFLHGHSFTANPIACAAAIETLNIYKDESLLDKAMQIEELYKSWLQSLPDSQNINVRYCGSVLAFELGDRCLGEGGYFKSRGREVCHKLLKKGIFMRPLGNVLYLCPPLNTNPQTILETLQLGTPNWD